MKKGSPYPKVKSASEGRMLSKDTSKIKKRQTLPLTKMASFIQAILAKFTQMAQSKSSIGSNTYSNFRTVNIFALPV